MTEQTQAAAPAAAETPAAPAPQAEEVTEAAIWKEIQDEKAAKADPTEPAGEPAGDPAHVTTPAASAPSAPAADDLWANATPEQRAAFEAAIAEKEKFEQRSRSASGRISALQRKLNAQAKPVEAPSAREAIAGIKTDYPELADPLDKVADAVDGTRDHISKTTQASVDADTAELNELVAAETASLVAQHPDYIDVLKANGPAFKAWVDDQPLRIRQAAIKNASYIADGEGAIEVLNGFKKHLGLIVEAPKPADTPAPPTQLDDRRQRQIAATASPQSSGGRPTISGIPEEGDPDAIWAAIQAEKKAKARA